MSLPAPAQSRQAPADQIRHYRARTVYEKRPHVHAAPAKTQTNSTPVLFTVPLTVMVFSGVAKPANESKVLLLRTGFAVAIMRSWCEISPWPCGEAVNGPCKPSYPSGPANAPLGPGKLSKEDTDCNFPLPPAQKDLGKFSWQGGPHTGGTP